MALGTPEIFQRGPYVVTPKGHKITTVYRVESTDGTEDDTELYGLAGIPQVADPYEGRNGVVDSLMRVRQVSVSREKGAKLFLVNVEYNTEWGGIDSNPPPENPLDRPIQVRIGSARYTENVQVDMFDRSFASSAHEPYGNGWPKSISAMLVVLTKNLPSFNTDAANAYKNKINSLPFTLPTGEVVAAGLALIDDIEATYKFEFDTSYVEVTTTLIIRPAAQVVEAIRSASGVEFTPSPWDTLIFDHGTYQNVNGVKLLILDDTGQVITTPVNLNGSGGQLAAGAEPKLQRFQFIESADFTLLDLIR